MLRVIPITHVGCSAPGCSAPVSAWSWSPVRCWKHLTPAEKKEARSHGEAEEEGVEEMSGERQHHGPRGADLIGKDIDVCVDGRRHQMGPDDRCVRCSTSLEMIRDLFERRAAAIARQDRRLRHRRLP